MDRLSALNMPQLTVIYDMGWQQWSSGNKYNSVSGHAFCIGGMYATGLYGTRN